MRVITRLHWPLILGLGALAMIHPLIATIGNLLGADANPALSIMLSLLISAAWIGVVGLTRVRRPVLTLVFAGLSYAVFSIVFSGTVSPLASGRLQGPLALPLTIIPVLISNGIWGAITGVLALALQRARGFRPERLPD